MGTLGQTIGVVSHTFSNKNDQEDKCKLTIKIDFSTASDTDIKAWLCSNRVIAFARPLSKLTLAEMEEQDGRTFVAQNIGRKIVSEAAQMAELEATIKSDPEKVKSILRKMELIEDETEE